MYGLRSHLIRILFAAVLFILPLTSSLALEQNEKLWLGINVEKPLTSDKRWMYLIFTQARLINQSPTWQTQLVEGAVGYNILHATLRVWLGYRWALLDPPNGFMQENRFWQQIIWTAERDNKNTVVLRSRLEESVYSRRSQPSFRLRERFLAEFWHRYFGVLNPLVYEELFFPLNKTSYTSHQLISQNRLFLGFNLRTASNAFWEIGYINQYQMHTPQNPQNAMSHVVSVTYIFN